MYLIRELAKLRFTSAREISFSLLACLTFTYKYVWNSIFLFLYVYTSLWLALFKYARSVITLAKLKSDFTRKARKECRALAKTYRGRLADEGACRSSCLVISYQALESLLPASQMPKILWYDVFWLVDCHQWSRSWRESPTETKALMRVVETIFRKRRLNVDWLRVSPNLFCLALINFLRISSRVGKLWWWTLDVFQSLPRLPSFQLADLRYWNSLLMC